MSNSDFYLETLEKLLNQGILNKDMNILVLCGNLYDQRIFSNIGFKNVTISNINTQQNAEEYEPYDWCFQDCENLSYENETFDFCIVHAGLHHCASPHRGLLEINVLGTNKFIFIRRLNLSHTLWHLKKLKIRYLELFTRLCEPFISGLSKVFPWFNNSCAFVVLKGRIPEDLHPWLKQDGDKIIVGREWSKARYK